MSLTQENILQIEDREGRRRTDLRRQHNYRLQGGSSSLAERIRALELKDSRLDQKEQETIQKCVKRATNSKEKRRKKYQKELKKLKKQQLVASMSRRQQERDDAKLAREIYLEQHRPRRTRIPRKVTNMGSASGTMTQGENEARTAYLDREYISD